MDSEFTASDMVSYSPIVSDGVECSLVNANVFPDHGLYQLQIFNNMSFFIALLQNPNNNFFTHLIVIIFIQYL